MLCDMYDCVLFDLDGTLTDSAPGIVASVEYALERMGRGALPEEWKRLYVGPPLLDSFQRLNGMTPDEALEGVRFFRERYSRVGWQENRVYPGVPALLRTLKARGVYLAVATAKPVAFAHQVLEHFGLAPYFDRICAAPMDESGLPKEELIRRALPEGAVRAAMVGDRMYDMEGARRAGVDGIGVMYGYGARDELDKAGARHICATVGDLAELLYEGAAPEPGLMLTFEGIDGCGKTTQLGMLRDWLELCGWQVTATREPGGCPLGERIRAMLLDTGSEGMTAECEALLFAASRAQHTATVLRPALQGGCMVLADRYVDSSMAYQGAGRGLGMEAVRGINRMATRGLEPDMTLLYRLDPERARARRQGEDDRIERERSEFHRRVCEGFDELMRSEPGRVKALDAALKPDALFERTRALTMELLARDAQRLKEKGTISRGGASNN